MMRILLGLFLAAFMASGLAAQGGYTIKPGDQLRIEVLEDEGLNRNALVLPDGSISFPLVGNVPAAGRSVSQVQADLVTGLRGNFATAPNVFVSVGALAEPKPARPTTAAPGMNVYILGEINGPGRLEVTPGTTMLQLIAEAGGLTRFAAGKRIELHRGDTVYPFNYRNPGSASSIKASTPLAPGDVVVVPQRRLFE